jgi:hypothetical protein
VQFVHPDGSPVNLTGADVTVVIRPHGGGELLLDSPASIVGDPLDGNAEYAWQPGDTDSPGAYDAEWPTTWAGGAEQTFPTEGYTTIDVTADLESAAVVIPDQPDYCWPVDSSCCAELDSYSTTVQERAKALAGMTLRSLTAHRVGGCAVTVRPCRQICEGYRDSRYFYGRGYLSPLNWNGTWFNCHCVSECGCGALSQVDLPAPIGRVDKVQIDGVTLPSSAYRVDDGVHLVRIDGQTWPDCQDLTAADDEDGAFAVTYLNAIPVDGLGAFAAGILACEYAKACSGGKCRLPAGVVSITRQGVSMDLGTGAFPNGRTGIREVDAYIESVNPYGLRTVPRVWTPDMALVRTTTWTSS